MNSSIYHIKNILDKTYRGWINIPGKEFEYFLCYNTKVYLLSREKEFEIIKIINEPFKNAIIKLPYKIKEKYNFVSFLEKKSNDNGNNFYSVRYDCNKNELSIPGLIKLATVYNKNPLPSGIYNILIPKFPHTKKCKKIYLDENNNGTRFAETWFQIDYDKRNNFIHFGKISDGCITVNDSGSNWTKFYMFLMNNSRKGNIISQLEIIL